MRLLFSFYCLVNFLKVWLSLFLSLCPHTHSTHPLSHYFLTWWHLPVSPAHWSLPVFGFCCCCCCCHCRCGPVYPFSSQTQTSNASKPHHFPYRSDKVKKLLWVQRVNSMMEEQIFKIVTVTILDKSCLFFASFFFFLTIFVYISSDFLD